MLASDEDRDVGQCDKYGNLVSSSNLSYLRLFPLIFFKAISYQEPVVFIYMYIICPLFKLICLLMCCKSHQRFICLSINIEADFVYKI